MGRRVYLIHEFNCYLGKPTLPDRLKFALRLTRSVPVEGFASVWIANDSFDPEVDDYETAALKLAGPLSSDDALQYLGRVHDVLVAAGLEVVEETVADD